MLIIRRHIVHRSENSMTIPSSGTSAEGSDIFGNQGQEDGDITACPLHLHILRKAYGEEVCRAREIRSASVRLIKKQTFCWNLGMQVVQEDSCRRSLDRIVCATHDDGKVDLMSTYTVVCIERQPQQLHGQRFDD